MPGTVAAQVAARLAAELSKAGTCAKAVPLVYLTAGRRCLGAERRPREYRVRRNNGNDANARRPHPAAHVQLQQGLRASPGAALALNYVHYNCCYIVRTIRVTPAMQVGITDDVRGRGGVLQAEHDRAGLLRVVPKGPAPPEPDGPAPTH